jgi:hypothetical protein
MRLHMVLIIISILVSKTNLAWSLVQICSLIPNYFISSFGQNKWFMRNLKTLSCPSCILKRECLLLCFQIGFCGSSYRKFEFPFRFWFCANLFQILTLLIAKAKAKCHQIEVSNFFFLIPWKFFAKRWKVEGGGVTSWCVFSQTRQVQKICAKQRCIVQWKERWWW